jgi:hypothetical protein
MRLRVSRSAAYWFSEQRELSGGLAEISAQFWDVIA